MLDRGYLKATKEGPLLHVRLRLLIKSDEEGPLLHVRLRLLKSDKRRPIVAC